MSGSEAPGFADSGMQKHRPHCKLAESLVISH